VLRAATYRVEIYGGKPLGPVLAGISSGIEFLCTVWCDVLARIRLLVLHAGRDQYGQLKIVLCMGMQPFVVRYMATHTYTSWWKDAPLPISHPWRILISSVATGQFMLASWSIGRRQVPDCAV